MLNNYNTSNFQSVNEKNTSININNEISETNKPIIITTALPYANGEIHIGHISSTYLPADIFTRFLRISRQQVFHICASDDFGTPIIIKAEKENKKP